MIFSHFFNWPMKFAGSVVLNLVLLNHTFFGLFSNSGKFKVVKSFSKVKQELDKINWDSSAVYYLEFSSRFLQTSVWCKKVIILISRPHITLVDADHWRARYHLTTDFTFLIFGHQQSGLMWFSCVSSLCLLGSLSKLRA